MDRRQRLFGTYSLQFTVWGPPSRHCGSNPKITCQLETTTRKITSRLAQRGQGWPELKPLNFGLAAAWIKATNRDGWRVIIVNRATLKTYYYCQTCEYCPSRCHCQSLYFYFFCLWYLLYVRLFHYSQIS